MKKTPSVFVRDWDGDTNYVTDQPNPECQWVFDGEGVPTRKYDGTCVMFDGQKWWARREIKPGKTPPENWIPVDDDDTTGKRMGWEPIDRSGWRGAHSEAVVLDKGNWKPGTYELCGPKVNKNPEGSVLHFLQEHAAAEELVDLGRTYADIVDSLRVLKNQNVEGIVYHHPDGRMAKIKVKDIKW